MQHNEPKDLDNFIKGMLWAGQRTMILVVRVTYMTTLHFTSCFNSCGLVYT